MKEKIRQFMIGRYGTDGLNQFLNIASLVLILVYICLAAIPAYAITDCGFIDVVQQKVIDPILEVVE